MGSAAHVARIIAFLPHYEGSNCAARSSGPSPEFLATFANAQHSASALTLILANRQTSMRRYGYSTYFVETLSFLRYMLRNRWGGIGWGVISAGAAAKCLIHWPLTSCILGVISSANPEKE